MSFVNSNFELNSTSSQSKSSNTETRVNDNNPFIPIDWETGIEEAINEPLPHVVPDNEAESDATSLKDESRNKSNLETNIVNKSGLSDINNPNKKMKPATPILKGNDSNIQATTEIIAENSEHYKRSSQESTMESLIKTFNADLDLETNPLPLQTPVKSAIFDKENFFNPQKKVNLNSIRNRHIHPSRLRTPSFSASNEQYATPVTVKQMPSLFKPMEHSSTSKFSIGKPKIQRNFETIKVNSTEYTVLKILGRGGSSVVYQCFNCGSMENTAIKCVSLDSSSYEGYLTEIDVLKKLQGCDRIIKMFDFEIRSKEKKLYMVLEMGSADLAQILKDLSVVDAVVPSYLILFYWMEMLYAVQQIHCHGIIHSDLKPANFLQVNGRLKLIDFGISSCLQNDSTSVIKTVSEGSSSYISPEALNCEYSNNRYSPNYGKPKYKISYKADVWSLGCILYQLIYKNTPFAYISNQMQKLMAIANDSVEIKYPDSNGIPEKFIQTVKKCLNRNAKLRPSVDELIFEYKQFCKV